MLTPVIVYPVTATHLADVFVSTLQEALQDKDFGKLFWLCDLKHSRTEINWAC